MINQQRLEHVENFIKDMKLEFCVSTKFHSDGDFGDLYDIDFSNGKLMGHIALWSSGLVFFNLFDDRKTENYEVIEESHFDAQYFSDSELISKLQAAFSVIFDRSSD